MDALDRIRQAAESEREAETSRDQAEQAWRSAWWETTLALAEPKNRADVTATMNEAKGILGQSRDYLHDRRGAGRVFMGLEPHVIRTLPPRLALAWAKVPVHKQADESTVIELHEAEREGVSLREYSEQFGQTFESMDKMVERNPEAAGKAVANHQQAYSATVRHRNEQARDRGERVETAARMRTPDLHEREDVVNAGNAISLAIGNLDAGIGYLLRVPSEKRAELKALLEGLDHKVGMIRTLLSGEDIDAEFRALVEGEGK